MTNGQTVNTPNQRRSSKLLVWAMILLGTAALMASAWEVWSLILCAGLFVLALLFAVWGLSVRERDNED